MKKILYKRGKYLFFLSLMLLMLTACTSSGGNDTPPAIIEATPTQTPEAVAEPTPIQEDIIETPTEEKVQKMVCPSIRKENTV